ncbi:hypothetical protein D3C80_925040 [compost metagenome]
MADDAGIAGIGQREAAGQLALGIVQFLLGRARLQVVGENALHQLERTFAELGSGLQVDHERAAYLHRAEYRVNAVGQAALLSHLAHQPGTEGATAKDLVAQRQGWPVRVLAVDPQFGQHQVGLLGREVDVGQAGLGVCGLGRCGQRRALGQAGRHLGGDGFGLCTAEVADQGDYRIAAGIGLCVERAQLGKAYARDALGGAVAWVGVGVVAIELAEKGLAGDLAGVLLLIFEASQHLVLDALEGILGECRLARHLCKQFEGRFALVLGTEAAQRCDGHVAVGAVAKICAQAFEALGDGGDVLAGHALVEHGVGQGGQAWRATILAAAGSEGDAQVEHGQFAGFDEQHPGTFGGVPVLDVQLTPAGCLAIQFGQRLQGVGRAGCAAVGLGSVIGHGRSGQHCRQRQGTNARGQQGWAWCAAITHGRTPRAVHGQRSGVRG